MTSKNRYTAWDVQDVVWPWKTEHPEAAVAKETARLEAAIG